MVQGNETEIPKAEGEPQVQTTEEQLKTLQAQIQQLQAERKEADKSYKGLQRTLTEKDRELKRQADLDSRINELQDTVETLATAITLRNNPEEVENEQRQDVVALLKKQRFEQETKRKAEATKNQQEEYNRQADAMYARAKVAFGEDDDAIERIEGLLLDGRLDRAEARIAKAEQAKTQQTQTKESDEQRIERLAQERINSILKERGLFEEFSSSPSGGQGGAQTAMSDYIAGKITADEAKRRGANFD